MNSPTPPKKNPKVKRKPSLSARWAWTIVLLVVLLVSVQRVRAADVDLNLTVVGQGYQTRTAAGDLLDRRRVTQWVDLRAGRLLGLDDLSLQISFRFDAELGLGNVFDDSSSRADLMLAQMRWR